MKINRLEGLPDVVTVTPSVYTDERGRFFETYRINELFGADGDVQFVQGNSSWSSAWVLRGLHYQTRDPQGKFVRCLQGKVFDVAVDMREGSPTLGKWVGTILDDIDCVGIWVPPGFAHGFLSIDRPALVYYECSSYYVEEFARSVKYDDPDIGITWPTGIGRTPVLSGKDRAAQSFAQAEKVRL